MNLSLNTKTTQGDCSLKKTANKKELKIPEFCFKVLREDLTSLGLLGASKKQYEFGVWNYPDEPLSVHPRLGGGLWVAPNKALANGLRRYVLKHHGIKTRIFRCRIGCVLHQTTCRIKTDKIFFSPEDEVL